MTGITTLLPVLLRPGDSVDSLLRAIDSVLTQEPGVPHELLIIDDGSEPPVAHAKARILRLETNHGIAYALNAGLTQAKYDWIARIDADDLWRPGKLQKQIAALEQNPDLTLVGSGMRLVHPADANLDRDERRGGDWRQTLELTTRIGCPFPHGSILARKAVFEALGGYPPVHGYEDFALWVKWMRFFPVAIVDEILLDYTVSPGQISSQFREHQEEATAALLKRFGDLGKVEEMPAAVSRIAATLGRPGFETGLMLHRGWMYADAIAADDELYPYARILFPDREVHRLADASELIVDKIFLLTRPGVALPVVPARVVIAADL